MNKIIDNWDKIEESITRVLLLVILSLYPLFKSLVYLGLWTGT
jgi:hypothetical protein